VEKPFGVAPDPPQDPMPALKRVDPSKNVEPLLMLASGIHHRLTPFLRPNPSQFRVEGKSRLILKKQHVFSFTS
jgi:hypothetical protein